MPHVVTEKCVKCKYTDCVEICPVDCFHEAAEFLVIDPEVCIDCGVCVPECPVEAIVNDETFIDGRSLADILKTENDSLTLVQKNAKYLTDFNKKQAQILPQITERKDPLPEADDFAEKNDKIKFVQAFDGKQN